MLYFGKLQFCSGESEGKSRKSHVLCLLGKCLHENKISIYRDLCMVNLFDFYDLVKVTVPKLVKSYYFNVLFLFRFVCLFAFLLLFLFVCLFCFVFVFGVGFYSDITFIIFVKGKFIEKYNEILIILSTLKAMH